ncbi:MAG: hypothetical protein EZS28_015986, partial [Streblomastix strix]
MEEPQAIRIIVIAQACKKFQEQNEVNIDGLSNEQMKSKDNIDQIYELEKAKPYKVYTDFGSVWQKMKQVYKHQQTLDEYHYSHSGTSADNSYKTLPNTVVRDKQTNDYFKQNAVDLLSDYQDTNHEDSATSRLALFSYLIVVYRLPLVPLSLVDEIHAMYISDIDKVINGNLCTRNCQMIFNTKNQNYKRNLARHLKYCYGPETAKQKLIATGQQELLSPTLNYITFDFETVENIINEDNLITQLEPLSVASAATINDQITTLYFDLRDGSDFIEQWINQLFEVAITVNEANQSNIPDITIEDKHYIPYKPQMSVIGFNSKKFDMNLLLKHLIKNKTKIQYMGSTIQAKQTIVSHCDYDFDLRFIDKLSFIPPNNTLKQFVEKFGTKGIKLTKGIFPYGSFNYDKNKQLLGQSESFTKEDFYDKLNSKNISNDDYAQYCNDSINFENRWDAFNGIFNKNNPFTDHRIYQAGGLSSYFKCTSISSKLKAHDV